jgi:cellobiose epimerase
MSSFLNQTLIVPESSGLETTDSGSFLPQQQKIQLICRSDRRDVIIFTPENRDTEDSFFVQPANQDRMKKKSSGPLQRTDHSNQKKKTLFLFILPALFLLGCSSGNDENQALIDALDFSLRVELLDAWYPRTLDSLHGGFLADFTYDWKPEGSQNKMVVTQTRQLWTSSEAARFYGSDEYRAIADHAYVFLRDVLWDEEYGGFYTTLSREGIPGQTEFGGAKMAYGNAFAIYALVAYYNLTGKEEILELAKKTFLWLEKYSHDPLYGGYFNNLQRNGSPLSEGNRDLWNKPPEEMPGYERISQKDQNTSIHLLEAFTELYKVWPEPLMQERLEEMVALISEKIVTPKGYLTLFLTRNWQPITFRDSSEAVIRRNIYTDHISFGHDIETGFLLLEAAHALGKMNEQALALSKKMVDHTIQNGWDQKNGGIYDQGYYFKGADTITIMHHAKVWWSEAEALNALLLMAKLFPEEDIYRVCFRKQWDYIQEYLIDHERGGWFEEGLDNSPWRATSPKASDWKVNYHNFRALRNCIRMLKDDFILLEEQTRS